MLNIAHKKWCNHLFIIIILLSSFNNTLAQNKSITNNNYYVVFDSLLKTDNTKANLVIEEIENQIKIEIDHQKRVSFKALKFLLQAKKSKFYKINYDSATKYYDSAIHYYNLSKDTMTSIKTTISYSSMLIDVDKIYSIINKSLPLSININDSLLIYLNYSQLARAEYLRGEYLAAFEYFKKGEKYIKTEKQYKDSDICHDATLIYKGLGLHSYSQKYLNKYLKFKLENAKSCELSYVYLMIAENHFDSKEYKKCLNNLNKMDISFQCGNLATKHYLVLIKTYSKLKQKDSLKLYINKLKTSKNFYTEPIKITINTIEADLLLQDKEYNKAKKKYQKIINFYQEKKLINLSWSLHHQIAICDEKMGNYNKAIKHAIKAFKLSSTNRRKINTGKHLTKLYKKEKKYIQALNILEKIDSITFLNNNFERKVIIQESKFEQENQILEYDNKTLQRKNELKENELSLSKERVLYRTILILILILFFSLLAYTFIKYRKQKTREKKVLLKEIQINREEIILLNEQLLSRQKTFKQKINISKKSVIEKLKSNDDWIELFLHTEELFKVKFNEFHKKYNTLTKKDLKMIALTFYKLSNKDIADIIFISENGVKKSKQRIRAKLNIQVGEKIDSFFLQTQIFNIS